MSLTHLLLAPSVPFDKGRKMHSAYTVRLYHAKYMLSILLLRQKVVC